jgi:immunity protein 70 of polymorphic toxin system
MGLYLAVFDGDEEIEGVEVGSYSDFAAFRAAIAEQLEGGTIGSRFPTLMLHSDSDGTWSPEEAARLQIELKQIGYEFRERPPAELKGWQAGVAASLGIAPKNLHESFFDVDGEPLLSLA